MFERFQLLLILFAGSVVAFASPPTFNLGDSTYTRINELRLPKDFSAYAIYRDGYIYAAGSDSFVVLHPTDQKTSTLVGSVLLTNTEIHQITLVQNVAYLTETNGLKLIDIAHPQTPLLLKAIPMDLGKRPYPFESPETVLFGNILYITAWDRLYSVDVTNPKQPGAVRTVFTSYGDHLYIKNDRAYVSGGNGVAMYEYPSWNLLATAPLTFTTDPFTSYPVPDFSGGVLGQGEFLYAFQEHYSLVRTYQRNGAALVAISTNYATYGSITHGTTRVWEDGDQIYAIGGNSAARFQIEASGKLHQMGPEYLISPDLDIIYGNTVSLLAGSACIATGGEIYLFDFASWPPLPVNVLPVSFSINELYSVGSVGLATLGPDPHCLGVFDLSQTSPRLVRQVQVSSDYSGITGVEGSTAYAQTATEVHRFEVKSDFTITETGSIAIFPSAGGGIRNLRVEQGRVFFLTNLYPVFLNIYDENLTNVLSGYVPPDSAGFYTTSFEIFNNRGYLFMETRNSSPQAAVYVLDLTNPASPKVITNVPIVLGSIARLDNFIFNLNYTNGVDVFDLRDPLNLKLVASNRAIANLNSFVYFNYLPQSDLVRAIGYVGTTPVYTYWSGGNDEIPQLLGTLTNINLTGPFRDPFLYLPDKTLSTYVKVPTNSVVYHQASNQFSVYFPTNSVLQSTESLSPPNWLDLSNQMSFTTSSIRPSQLFRVKFINQSPARPNSFESRIQTPYSPKYDGRRK